MNKALIIFILCLGYINSIAQNNTIQLKGELKNFGSEVVLSKETPEAQLLKETIKLNLDEHNRFEVSFELLEPAYFSLGRNTLYLSPGDHMKIIVDNDNPNNSTFIGTGSEVCTYLKARPYPKAGSYLYGTDVLKGDPTTNELAKNVAKEVRKREAKLDALKEADDFFKKVEHGRILFDAANTLMSYGFRDAYAKKIAQEQMKAYADSITNLYVNDIREYLLNGSDKDYLNTSAYLSVVDKCIEELGADKMDAEVLDFLKVHELVYLLNRKGPVAEVLGRKNEVEADLSTQKYKSILNKGFEKYQKLLPGNMAPALELTSMDGQAITLADFKGKVIVIDVWATWCGPCKAEAPYFEALAKKYQSDKVEFISISIDSSEKPWRKYLEGHEKTSTQYITPRPRFKEFQLITVPRFMIIDKDGRLIDAFAPVPSNEEFEKLIIKAVK
ncbi:TlpA disulfide reductase family protein [Carboxylicivirga sp. M1479]|uniref:TlpA family protein disulfide reductase n=1 Tax=Carboxylicivirga sp. M1479 TaxID=2594476 RepID=UPI00163D6CFA|nr:TlpA disulfide reductase family protein [Carboxylicivirga sp. M1479]